MKSLKFDHHLADAIINGEKTSTWRINDDKDLSVDDSFVVIDKVDPHDKQIWKGIGVATIQEVLHTRLKNLDYRQAEEYQQFESSEMMYAMYQKYYGEGVGPDTPVNVINFSFTPYKQHTSYAALEVADTPTVTDIKLYADGGSRGNPGPSDSGFVIMDRDNKILLEHGVYLGVTTNNQAEYKALKLGLEEAQKMHVKEIDVYMDSLLVVNQMLGKFKVRNRDLWPIHNAIQELTQSFKRVSFTPVPRELNKLADAMVNKALDSQLNHNSF